MTHWISEIKNMVFTGNHEGLKENANMNTATPSGKMMKVASEVGKQIATTYLAPAVLSAHEQGTIHIHDLDYYPTQSVTCVQHPLEQLLTEGLEIYHTELLPPTNILEAVRIVGISLQMAQNEMHGGQSIPALDFYLAPFVRKTYEQHVHRLATIFQVNPTDVLSYSIPSYLEDINDSSTTPTTLTTIQQGALHQTKEDVLSAMSWLIHELNTTHCRGGNQVVFSSLNYGTDTSMEGQCVIWSILKATEKGIGKGTTAIFPIQVFKVKKGVNFEPTDPNYALFQLACEVSGKRFFPNFLNLDAPFNQHEGWNPTDPKRYLYEVATMGCRTRVFENVQGEKTTIGRGNASFTTINLVQLALQSKNESPVNPTERFFELVSETMDLVKEQLADRLRFQQQAHPSQFPFTMKYLYKEGKLEDIENAQGVTTTLELAKRLQQATLGIGIIGLAETLLVLHGSHHGESKSAQKLGLSIMEFMTKRIQGYKKETNLNYALLGTPAESLCYRLPKLDRKRFGVVKGVNDRDYYTNSTHVPVWAKVQAWEKLQVEAPYHPYLLAGHIAYIEADGVLASNPTAVEAMVKASMSLNVGYFSINHTKVRCLDCNQEQPSVTKTCYVCGSEEIDVLQRITGYLVGSTSKWNQGKKSELEDRVVHSMMTSEELK